VSAPSPLCRLFAAVDGAMQRVVEMPWGAVVTDPRFPLIHDANYARVDDGRGLTLTAVREALVPALRRAGASHFHVATFDPTESKPLLDELERAGAKFTYLTSMRLEASVPDAMAGHDVREVRDLDDRFWREQRIALPELGVRTPEVIEQFVAWQQQVMVPFGKRWFAVEAGGRRAGFGALLLHDGVGYVDDVVTLPEERGRGIASAIVARIVDECAGRSDDVLLLTEEHGPIALYERLGFREAGLVAGALLPLP